MRKIKTDRSLLMYILLTIVTCGIYSYWFIYTIAQDLNEICKEDGEKTYISVKKYWKSEGKNPDSIKVSLIKDGEIIDWVVLNAENNWYHKWDNIDKNHSWNVVETDVPSGYKASYITSQMTVIITNTDDDYEEDEED